MKTFIVLFLTAFIIACAPAPSVNVDKEPSDTSSEDLKNLEMGAALEELDLVE